MFSIDLAFWKNKIVGWVRWKLGLRVEGFEDEFERTIRGFAKASLGVDVVEGAFDG
jgi:aarF domain-containing kinase